MKNQAVRAGVVRVGGVPGALRFVSAAHEGRRGCRPWLLEIDDALAEFAVEELPAMRRSDLKGALENLAAAHVPGRMDGYAMDYLSIRRAGGGRRAVMVIIRREILDEIRRSHPFTPIAVPGAVSRLSAEGEGRKSGGEGKGGSGGSTGGESEGGGEGSTGGGEGRSGAGGGRGRGQAGRELFPPKGGRPVDRLLAAAVLLLLVGAGLSFWAEERRSRGRRITAEARQQLMHRDSAAVRDTQERLDSLDAEWETLIRSRPRRLSRLFAALARDSGAPLTPIEIRSFTVNGRRFYLRGEAPDALALARLPGGEPRVLSNSNRRHPSKSLRRPGRLRHGGGLPW